MVLPKLARDTLKKTSSITFLEGKRDKGKTDFAFKLGEEALKEGLISIIGTNVRMKSEPPIPIASIKDFESLERWGLEAKGRKMMILDEFGVVAGRRAFGSKLNKLMLKLFQLVRKYDMHLILIAPHFRFTDSILENTDILDLHIIKKTRKMALLRLPHMRFAIRFLGIMPTTIPFDTKDIAEFTEKDPTAPDKLLQFDREVQYAIRYAYGENFTMMSRKENRHEQLIKNDVKKGIKILYELLNAQHIHTREVNLPASINEPTNKAISV